MRKISFWAKEHVWQSRLIIISIYLLLNGIGWLTGNLLLEIGVALGQGTAYLLSFLFILSVMLYPVHKNRQRHKNIYANRKMVDILLSSITFYFIVFTANQNNPYINQNSWVRATVIKNTNSSFIEEKPQAKAPIPNKSLRTKKPVLKKLLHQIKKQYRKADTAGKVGLIALAILIAIILIYLLGALSCSIACSGSEGLAYVIFFLGTGAVIFFLVRIIRRIIKGNPNKPTEIKEA